MPTISKISLKFNYTKNKKKKFTYDLDAIEL